MVANAKKNCFPCTLSNEHQHERCTKHKNQNNQNMSVAVQRFKKKVDYRQEEKQFLGQKRKVTEVEHVEQ